MAAETTVALAEAWRKAHSPEGLQAALRARVRAGNTHYLPAILRMYDPRKRKYVTVEDMTDRRRTDEDVQEASLRAEAPVVADASELHVPVAGVE